jgi:hypothetical protein
MDSHRVNACIPSGVTFRGLVEVCETCHFFIEALGEALGPVLPGPLLVEEPGWLLGDAIGPALGLGASETKTI